MIDERAATAAEFLPAAAAEIRFRGRAGATLGALVPVIFRVQVSAAANAAGFLPRTPGRAGPVPAST
jgi:hypothetical protein